MRLLPAPLTNLLSHSPTVSTLFVNSTYLREPKICLPMKRSIALVVCSLCFCYAIHAQTGSTAPAGQTGSATPFTGSSTPNGFSVLRGINVSHWLSQVGNGHPIKYDDQDATWLATLGFDNVRLPIDEVNLDRKSVV